MVNNINFVPLHEILLFPETFQTLCSLTLLPYVYMVHNRNFAPLRVLSSVGFLASRTAFINPNWLREAAKMRWSHRIYKIKDFDMYNFVSLIHLFLTRVYHVAVYVIGFPSR